MKERFLIICILLTVVSGVTSAQNSRRSASAMKLGNRSFFPVRKKPDGQQKKRLQPQPSDVSRYAQFLSQPNTGIFRLFPDLGCEDNPNIIKADKKCLETIPESSFYSFREKEHTAGYLSDIRLKSDHLISDGVLTQGFFVRLGDIALDKVSLSTGGLKFMQNYDVLAESTGAQKQFSELVQGIKAGGFVYRKIEPVSINTTYAVRIVAFRGGIFRIYRGYRYNLLDGDDRVDLTVAFRIIRKNDDDSLTLIWKELEKRDAPKFQRPKSKKKQ